MFDYDGDTRCRVSSLFTPDAVRCGAAFCGMRQKQT